MPVGQLLASISSRELTEWQAFFRLEPFGEERADLRAGIIASTMANTARDPKQRPRPFEPREFMPQFDDEPVDDEMEQAALWARVNEVMFALGGRAADGATGRTGLDWSDE